MLGFTIGSWKVGVHLLVIPALVGLTHHNQRTLRPTHGVETPAPCKPGAAICTWTDANGVTHTHIDDSGMGKPKG
jgi:hypothetical protein